MNPIEQCMSLEQITYFITTTGIDHKWITDEVVIMWPENLSVGVWQWFGNAFCFVPWTGV